LSVSAPTLARWPNRFADPRAAASDAVTIVVIATMAPFTAYLFYTGLYIFTAARSCPLPSRRIISASSRRKADG
jgi:hypothetical protein